MAVRMLVACSVLLSTVTAQYNNDPPTPLSHACGKIIDISNGVDYDDMLSPSLVLECLTSVPFNPAVGTRFLRYYNQTLQFHSTATYLKNPPPGYQQPAFDIFGSLQTIQNRIDAGYYRNQYAFELDVQQVSLNIHDVHMALYGGIISEFSFSIPYYLVAISKDGMSLPEVYVYDTSSNSISSDAIKTLGGQPAVQWLTQYASEQVFGMLEGNADWNQIMVSPSQLVIGSTNALSGGGNFYAGDTLNVTYADGTEEVWDWIVYYNDPGCTGPLTTGGDFYNYFVLGLLPANYDEACGYTTTDDTTSTTDDSSSQTSDMSTSTDYQSSTSTITADPSSSTSADSEGYDYYSYDYDACEELTSWNSINTAYPNETLVYEYCLGQASSGTITGYLFEDISLGVLSIPTLLGANTTSFTIAAQDFVQKASSAKRVLIDLQSCAGGRVDLAFTLFSQFFPNNSPYAGSNIRDHALANEFGTNLTGQFTTPDPNSDDGLSSYYLDGSEWVVADRIDARTGRNFTSWRDFYGPVTQSGGQISNTEQYDLTNLDNFLGFSYPDCHGNGSCHQPWTADEIVILTDGTCSSACALFVQMMTEAGVKTIAVGGLPEKGPMQAVSGSRGAIAYLASYLDSDAILAYSENYNFDPGMDISSIGITLRNQVQKDNTMPVQLLYQPANCRIYWSMNNYNNYTALWHDAYHATWSNTSLCIPGSVNAQPPAPKNQSTTFDNTVADYIIKSPLHEQLDTAYSPHDGKPPGIQYCSLDSKGNPLKSSCVKGSCQYLEFPCEVSDVRKRWVCIQNCTIAGNTDTVCPGQCVAEPKQKNGKAIAAFSASGASTLLQHFSSSIIFDASSSAPATVTSGASTTRTIDVRSTVGHCDPRNHINTNRPCKYWDTTATLVPPA